MYQYIFELYCIFVVVAILPFTQYYGVIGWFAITALGYFSCVIDYLYFPNCKRNIDFLRKRGYTPKLVWGIMLLNLCLTNALVGCIYSFYQINQVSFVIIAKVIVNMLLTEICFTIAHLLLHHTECGSSIHVLHHCCKYASWSTNLIFHPLDLAAEFSGPVLAILGMHAVVWQDTNTLLLSTILLHVWYALDHSALIKLPHTKHHSQVNSMYCIYITKHFTNYDFGEEKVKLKLKKIIK